jgi:hypothetical protein
MEDNEMNSLVQRAVGVFREHGELAVPEAARFALLVAEDVIAHSEYAAVAEDLSVILTIGADGINGNGALHSMSITQAHALAQELLEAARVAALNAAPPRTQHYDTITAPAKLTDYSGVFDWEEP